MFTKPEANLSKYREYYRRHWYINISLAEGRQEIFLDNSPHISFHLSRPISTYYAQKCLMIQRKNLNRIMKFGEETIHIATLEATMMLFNSKLQNALEAPLKYPETLKTFKKLAYNFFKHIC